MKLQKNFKETSRYTQREKRERPKLQQLKTQLSQQKEHTHISQRATNRLKSLYRLSSTTTTTEGLYHTLYTHLLKTNYILSFDCLLKHICRR